MTLRPGSFRIPDFGNDFVREFSSQPSEQSAQRIVSYYDDRDRALETWADEVAGEVGAVSSGLQSQITTLNGTVSTHTSQIGTLQGDLSVAEANISNLLAVEPGYPRGNQNYLEFTSNSATTNATTIWIATLSITTPVDMGGRRMRWVFQGNVISTGANDYVVIGFDTNNGSFVDRGVRELPVAGVGYPIFLTWDEDVPANTTRTRRLGINRNSGTGLVGVVAFPDFRSKFYVDDVGSA